MKKNNDKLVIIILILAFVFTIYRNTDYKLGEDYRKRINLVFDGRSGNLKNLTALKDINDSGVLSDGS